MPSTDADYKDADPASRPHESRKADVIACAVICFAIAAVFVALRFYTRTRIVKVLAASDWFLLAAVIGSGLQSAFFILETRHGLGLHVWDFDIKANFRDLQQASYFAVLWYNTSLVLVKVSLLLLYLKIFTYQRAGLLCRFILGLAVLTGTYGIVLAVTSCIPIRAAWDWDVENAYCHSSNLWWINTTLHVVTDFLIWSVPLPYLWRMTVPKPQKITLITLFSLGFVVAFISIIRVIFLEDLKRNQDPDFTWVGARFGFLSIIELNAAITVASIITLKPLADRLIPSLLQTASLEELPGEAPPTIGTRPVPPSAGHSSRDRSKNDSDLEEAWELARTDFESYRVASTSTSHR